MNILNVIIKGVDGVNRIADLDNESPFRITRQSLIIGRDKLKKVGGSYTTKLKLPKESKRNAVIFKGKGDIKSQGRYKIGERFDAIVQENGTELARGKFILKGVDSQHYTGVFLDENAAWIERLEKVRLNKLGYVSGSPTWLADFEGVPTFNAVNDLSNRQTHFVCPTALYQNIPQTDFLNLTDAQLFGEFNNDNELIAPPLSFPSDYNVIQGFSPRVRMGLSFDMFPPAMYYRNVIEKLFAEVGLSVDCSLFYEDWFNALIMTYEGTQFLYNWRNLGLVSAETKTVEQNNVGEFDAHVQTRIASESDINLFTSNTNFPIINGTRFWIGDAQFSFKFAHLIKHDKQASLVDKVTLTNSFDRVGRYKVPTTGRFKIEAAGQYQNTIDDAINLLSGQAYFIGSSVLNNFGTWNANTVYNDFLQSWYRWDDNLLIVLRRDQNGNYSPQTETALFKWMNGESLDFTQLENDVIAYFSPKRYMLKQGGANIPAREISGSPYSGFTEDVQVLNGGTIAPYVSHEIKGTHNPKVSESEAHISIEADLKKDDLIEIFWVSLDNIHGEALFSPDVEPEFSFAAGTTRQRFGDAVVNPTSDPNKAFYKIAPLCGTDKLDLAANLPDVSGKEFAADFIESFQLHYDVSDSTVRFYRTKQFYESPAHDITKRVDFDFPWQSEPIATPKTWVVGYNNDTDDRLLSSIDKFYCGQNVGNSASYGNLTIENQSAANFDVIRTQTMFSATRFVRSVIPLNPFGFSISAFPHSWNTKAHPNFPNLTIDTGFTIATAALNIDLSYDFPSMVSDQDFKVKKYSDWGLKFGKRARLLYHLGTVNQYTSYDSNYGVMIGNPRPITSYLDDPKHWFYPTVSQFDGENAQLTGIQYPTLRFDGVNGRWVRFFENLIEEYNNSETITVRAALTKKDWFILKNTGNIRLLGQLYRLMIIKDYDPQDGNNAIIKLFKKV